MQDIKNEIIELTNYSLVLYKKGGENQSIDKTNAFMLQLIDDDGFMIFV